MSKIEVVLQLQRSAQALGHSPQRREIPSLAMKCYNEFGSFNKAKIEAGLDIKNKKIDKFPKRAFELDKDLAAIISYITFDGHLYKNFRGLFYSSKNLSDLQEFEKVMRRKFGFKGNYHLNNSGSRKQTHVIYFFSKRVCEFLFKIGVPKGDKAIQVFDVPLWIQESKEFSREYLKIAFLCEGSLEREEGRNPRISFIQAKEINIIDSGLNFMSTIKSMLNKFEIKTGKSGISKLSRVRKRDNKMTKDIKFRIRTSDSNRFISEISWLK